MLSADWGATNGQEKERTVHFLVRILVDEITIDPGLGLAS